MLLKTETSHFFQKPEIPANNKNMPLKRLFSGGFNKTAYSKKRSETEQTSHSGGEISNFHKYIERSYNNLLK